MHLLKIPIKGSRSALKFLVWCKFLHCAHYGECLPFMHQVMWLTSVIWSLLFHLSCRGKSMCSWAFCCRRVAMIFLFKYSWCYVFIKGRRNQSNVFRTWSGRWPRQRWALFPAGTSGNAFCTTIANALRYLFFFFFFFKWPNLMTLTCREPTGA